MLLRRRQRLLRIVLVLAVLAVALSLVLYALRQNIDLYFTPSQLLQHRSEGPQIIRLGGMVRPHSLRRAMLDPLQQHFVLQDARHQIGVDYRGILPALFHDGQGIIVQGHWYPHNHRFVALQVLAKHDARYRPPGVT